MILRSERGMITIDFSLALFVAIGFGAVLFAIAVTFSLVEVTQYLAFSTARSYVAGHVSPEAQKDLGKLKFTELISGPVFKGLYALDMMRLQEPEFGDFSSEFSGNPNHDSFTGVRLPAKANLLQMRIPILGNLASDDKTGSVNISAYMLREVSNEECVNNFVQKRYSKLKQIDPAYSAAPANIEIFISDNGC